MLTRSIPSISTASKRGAVPKAMAASSASLWLASMPPTSSVGSASR